MKILWWTSRDSKLCFGFSLKSSSERVSTSVHNAEKSVKQRNSSTKKIVRICCCNGTRSKIHVCGCEPLFFYFNYFFILELLWLRLEKNFHQEIFQRLVIDLEIEDFGSLSTSWRKHSLVSLCSSFCINKTWFMLDKLYTSATVKLKTYLSSNYFRFMHTLAMNLRPSVICPL